MTAFFRHGSYEENWLTLRIKKLLAKRSTLRALDVAGEVGRWLDYNRS